jgi:peptidylprolyl isomerase
MRLKPGKHLTMLSLLEVAAFSIAAAPAPVPDRRPHDPQNTLVVETSKGRVIVEMRPDFAPLAVARVKLLAREGVYDGLQFHRVIDHFVGQTGNPNNKDGGVSSHPDLAPEFTFRLAADPLIVRRASDGVEGFVGATPFGGVSDLEKARTPDLGRRAWGAYCPGVVGMGRQAAETTANSEIFFMRDAARRLDRDYTVWGRVVSGLDVVRAVAIGEPPTDPDRMLKVRVAADLPATDRPKLEVMNERGPAFAALVDKARKAKGADFTVCDVAIPTR